MSLRDTDPAANVTTVRTDRHKLTAVHGLDSGELYDLEDDPNETHNRWNDPDCALIKMEVFKRLCDRMAWTVGPLSPHLLPAMPGHIVQPGGIERERC